MARPVVAALALVTFLGWHLPADAADCPDAHWKAGSRAPEGEAAGAGLADIPAPAIPGPATGDEKAPPAAADGAVPGSAKGVTD
ncbi:MAG TPA: hypothetical protein PLG99_01780 [Kaistiaceae bacterium]|nr:hypothetical protein [Kaistiaceae bacterium]